MGRPLGVFGAARPAFLAALQADLVRPILFITTDDDRLVPPDESESLYAKAGEPKKLITLKGYGHYEVYTEPAFSEVMAHTVSWFEAHLPADSD